MTFVCLSNPAWSTDAGRWAEPVAALLRIAPRVRIEPAGLIWLDARSLDPARMIHQIRRAMPDRAMTVGVASTPVAAALAAKWGSAPVTIVPAGEDRRFLASHPLIRLRPPPSKSLGAMLTSLGITTCEALASLEREAVEVRLGGTEAVGLWRLARGDDTRLLFQPRLRQLPEACLEWVDYGLERQEQAVFIIHSLLGTVCDELRAEGRGARVLVLEFRLTDGARVERTIRSSTPTTDQKLWLRLIR